jgi:hypothetical protein
VLAGLAVFARLAIAAVPAAAAGDAAAGCPNLYTDGEARDLAQRAQQLDPLRKFRQRNAVFGALGVDPTRLCDLRVVQVKVGYVESWQISDGFDIRWGFRGSRISRVRVVPRDASLSETHPRAVVGPRAVVEDVKKGWLWMATALSSSGYAADLSPASLREIDRFFDEQSRRGKARPGGLLSRELGQRLFGIGAYVGEVIRRARGGEWIADDHDPEAEVNVAVRLTDGTILWPVQRVMKRFKNGPEDGIAAYGTGMGLQVGPGQQ